MKEKKIYTVGGVTGTLSELSNHFGIPYNTAFVRISRGWSIEKTFSTPVKKVQKRERGVVMWVGGAIEQIR